MAVAWLGGSALVLINVVTLRRDWLIIGWVTVSVWVGKPSQYVTSHLVQLSLQSLQDRIIEYQPFWLVLLGRARSPVSGGR